MHTLTKNHSDGTYEVGRVLPDGSFYPLFL